MALTGCRVAPTPSLCSYRRKGRTKRNNHFTTSAVGDGVYSVVEAANGTLKGALANGGGLAPAASFAGGLAASFAPCSLSLVPLTLGYVGSLSGGEGQDLRWASASFCTGMTITFTSLGFTAGLVGSAYGGLGVERGLEEGAAAVAVMSGLRLLGVMPPVEKVFPSFEQGRRGEGEPVPPLVRAGCAGGASALCASPCSTPVLASLLAFVAASESPAQVWIAPPFLSSSLSCVIAAGVGSRVEGYCYATRWGIRCPSSAPLSLLAAPRRCSG